MLWLSALVATKVNGMIIHGASTRGLRLVRAVLAGDPDPAPRSRMLYPQQAQGSGKWQVHGDEEHGLVGNHSMLKVMFMFGVETSNRQGAGEAKTTNPMAGRGTY